MIARAGRSNLRQRSPARLGIFGNKDQNPSPEDGAGPDAALSAANVPHEFHQYDGAGHVFQDFVTPERYRQEQATDAWAKIRVCLTENLG